MVVCGVLFLFYKLMVKHVQKKHDKEYGKAGTGTHGEGTGHEKREAAKATQYPAVICIFLHCVPRLSMELHVVVGRGE